MPDNPYPGVQAVTRALSLLNLFSDNQPEWTLAELTAAAELNRTTVYRLLTALESFDMVKRDRETDRYRLGSGIIALAGRALRANPVRTLSRPELEKLAAISGETATLEVLSGDKILVLDEVLGKGVIQSSPSVGTFWPAFATSTGNAIMAFLPPAELDAILQAPLPQITAKTITSPQILRQQLAQIRRQGYAVVSEALELGFVAVGAPLRNADGYPVAAISLGGPTIRLTEAYLPELGALLRDAAARISQQLGYR
ncbi:MAG: IclR family transcriptional regulator [Chloroflexi bacterium]|nr:IclR family transcriptional regulator [Chloroflexota bacterium]